MNKIKTMLQGIFKNFRRVSARYPLTMILIIAASLIACLFIDQSGTLGKFMEDKGLHFVMLWGVGTFFAESFFAGKKALKWCMAAAGGIIAALLIFLTGHESELIRESASHWTLAYVIILTVLGVYRNYRNAGLPFNEYWIRVQHELARLAIICGITSAGIALVMSTFVTLILNGEHFMLVLRAEFLVIGILFGSGLLDALIKLDRELPRFFIFIIKYLLTGLLLAAFAIIYGYILKIVITRVVPSNEIFRILAGLFLIGLPIWTYIGTFKPDHWFIRVGVKLPYIFIPFLFLQGYAIRERIAAFGMTPLRYACLTLMLFEVTYIIVYAVRRRETGIMLPVTAVLVVISLVVPGINMYDVANHSQKAIFDRSIAADFDTISAEDQSSLAGSYYYLAGNAAGKAMLQDVDPLKIEAIKASGLTGNLEYDQNLYVYYDFPVRDIPISGYEQMTILSTFTNAEKTEEIETYDPENISFYDATGNLILNADLSEFVNKTISSWKTAHGGTPDFSGSVTLPDGSLLQVYQCSLTLEPEQKLTWLNISAVLLK